MSKSGGTRSLTLTLRYRYRGRLLLKRPGTRSRPWSRSGSRLLNLVDGKVDAATKPEPRMGLRLRIGPRLRLRLRLRSRLLRCRSSQAQTISQRIEARPMLRDSLRPGAEAASLRLVLPAVKTLVCKIRTRTRRDQARDRAATRTARGGDASACRARVFGVGAAEQRLGRVGDEGHLV